MAVDEENVTRTENIIVSNVNVNTNLSQTNINISGNVNNNNMNNSISGNNIIVTENNPSNAGTNPSGQKRRIAPTMLN
jgi:hypothetical protein